MYGEQLPLCVLIGNEPAIEQVTQSRRLAIEPRKAYVTSGQASSHPLHPTHTRHPPRRRRTRAGPDTERAEDGKVGEGEGGVGRLWGNGEGKYGGAQGAQVCAGARAGPVFLAVGRRRVGIGSTRTTRAGKCRKRKEWPDRESNPGQPQI
jgi:hypothetical protein